MGEGGGITTLFLTNSIPTQRKARGKGNVAKLAKNRLEIIRYFCVDNFLGSVEAIKIKFHFLGSVEVIKIKFSEVINNFPETSNYVRKYDWRKLKKEKLLKQTINVITSTISLGSRDQVNLNDQFYQFFFTSNFIVFNNTVNFDTIVFVPSRRIETSMVNLKVQLLKFAPRSR